MTIYQGLLLASVLANVFFLVNNYRILKRAHKAVRDLGGNTLPFRLKVAGYRLIG